MTTETRYAIYVIHPETGAPAWFKAPGEGYSYDSADAFLWSANDLDEYIREVLSAGGDWGTKFGEYPCRIRPVPVSVENIERSPAPEHEECPHCDGTGDEHRRPYYECHHCAGTGSVSAAEDA